jgi:hypothetical protein
VVRGKYGSLNVQDEHSDVNEEKWQEEWAKERKRPEVAGTPERDPWLENQQKWAKHNKLIDLDDKELGDEEEGDNGDAVTLLGSTPASASKALAEDVHAEIAYYDAMGRSPRKKGRNKG